MSLLNQDQLDGFDELGFAGPLRLVDAPLVDNLSRELYRQKRRFYFCHAALSSSRLTKKLLRRGRWGRAGWKGGIHALSSEIRNLAADPRIVEPVSQILGPDLILSESVIVSQRPGRSHPWHVDVEHGEWGGVTVWLALANVTETNAMKVMSRSHRIPSLPCHHGDRFDGDRDDDAAVLATAIKYDSQCAQVKLSLQPGECCIMHGGLWHAIANDTAKVRYAVVLRYCRADTEIRWPVDRAETGGMERYPIPCILVRGKNGAAQNLLIDPAY